MSLSTQTASGAVAAEKTLVDLRGMWIGLGLLNSFYLFVRVWLARRLDSIAPEFQTLWAEIPLMNVHRLLGKEGVALLTE